MTLMDSFRTPTLLKITVWLGNKAADKYRLAPLFGRADVGKIPHGHRWDLPRSEFAPDSPLEGNGFELPVSRREAVNRDGRRTGCPEIGRDLLRNRRFESISLQAFVGRTGDLLETAMPLARLGDAITITDG